MFHKVKSVAALPNYRLSVQFSEGVTKLYDVNTLFDKIPAFRFEIIFNGLISLIMWRKF